MKRIDQTFQARALPSTFFTTTATGALLFDGQCLSAAVDLAFDEMKQLRDPAKCAHSFVIAPFLEQHFFNAVVMYWELTGGFPVKSDIEPSLDFVGEQICFRSSDLIRAFDLASSWLLKGYDERNAAYVRRVKRSKSYPREKAKRAEVSKKMDLATSRIPQTFKKFVLPSDFFSDVTAGALVLTPESLDRALRLGFDRLRKCGDDYWLLTQGVRDALIGETMKHFYDDVIRAAAEKAQEYPTLTAINDAEQYMRARCASGWYPTDGWSLLLPSRRTKFEEHKKDQADFDSKRLNALHAAKFSQKPVAPKQSKILL